MRRLISFVLAIALLGSGLSLLYLELFVARTVKFHFMEAGGFIATLGAGWLWEDFIEPWLRGDGPTLTPASPGCTIATRMSHASRWEARDPGERLRGGQLSKGTALADKNALPSNLQTIACTLRTTRMGATTWGWGVVGTLW